MSIFDSEDFKPIEKIAGRAVLSVTSSGVSFSKQAVSKLMYASYVQVFISRSKRVLGVRMCEKSDPNAMKFVNQDKKRVDYVRWNNADFTKEVNSISTPEAIKSGYKVEGEFLEEENALLFDFNKLETIDN